KLQSAGPADSGNRSRATDRFMVAGRISLSVLGMYAKTSVSAAGRAEPTTKQAGTSPEARQPGGHGDPQRLTSATRFDSGSAPYGRARETVSAHGIQRP